MSARLSRDQRRAFFRAQRICETQTITCLFVHKKGLRYRSQSCCRSNVAFEQPLQDSDHHQPAPSTLVVRLSAICIKRVQNSMRGLIFGALASKTTV